MPFYERIRLEKCSEQYSFTDECNLEEWCMWLGLIGGEKDVTRQRTLRHECHWCHVMLKIKKEEIRNNADCYLSSDSIFIFPDVFSLDIDYFEAKPFIQCQLSSKITLQLKSLDEGFVRYFWKVNTKEVSVPKSEPSLFKVKSLKEVKWANIKFEKKTELINVMQPLSVYNKICNNSRIYLAIKWCPV